MQSYTYRWYTNVTRVQDQLQREKEHNFVDRLRLTSSSLIRIRFTRVKVLVDGVTKVMIHRKSIHKNNNWISMHRYHSRRCDAKMSTVKRTPRSNSYVKRVPNDERPKYHPSSPLFGFTQVPSGYLWKKSQSYKSCCNNPCLVLTCLIIPQHRIPQRYVWIIEWLQWTPILFIITDDINQLGKSITLPIAGSQKWPRAWSNTFQNY